ncbi:DUF6702 family protein [Chryseobacterium sp. A301]
MKFATQRFWFFPFLLLFCFASFAKAGSNPEAKVLLIHPYHVGSVEFNYSSQSQTFQITGRFFLDDLENALRKKTGKILYFQNESMKKSLNEALRAYLSENLRLRVEGEFLNIDYLGFEEDSESVVVYLESSKVETPRKVEVAVSALYNLFDDQINIIHLTVEGKRQSQRLNYPDRYLFKEF